MNVYCVVYLNREVDDIKSIHSSHKKARIHRNKYLMEFYNDNVGYFGVEEAYARLLNMLELYTIQGRVVDPE